MIYILKIQKTSTSNEPEKMFLYKIHKTINSIKISHNKINSLVKIKLLIKFYLAQKFLTQKKINNNNYLRTS